MNLQSWLFIPTGATPLSPGAEPRRPASDATGRRRYKQARRPRHSTIIRPSGEALGREGASGDESTSDMELFNKSLYASLRSMGVSQAELSATQESNPEKQLSATPGAMPDPAMVPRGVIRTVLRALAGDSVETLYKGAATAIRFSSTRNPLKQMTAENFNALLSQGDYRILLDEETAFSFHEDTVFAEDGRTAFQQVILTNPRLGTVALGWFLSQNTSGCWLTDGARLL